MRGLLIKIAEDAMPEVERRLAAKAAMEERGEMDGGKSEEGFGLLGL